MFLRVADRAQRDSPKTRKAPKLREVPGFSHFLTKSLGESTALSRENFNDPRYPLREEYMSNKSARRVIE